MWFFNLISNVLVARKPGDEYTKSCTTRLLLDIPWLSSVRILKKVFFRPFSVLQGLLIFLVTIVKNRKTVIKDLKESFPTLVSQTPGKDVSQATASTNATF